MGSQAGAGERLRQVEQENARLQRAVAGLTLDNQMRKEITSGNF